MEDKAAPVRMTDEEMAKPEASPKPRRKRGPKPAADLDAVTRVGAEFRAAIPPDGSMSAECKATLIAIVATQLDFSRLAIASADMTPEQRVLATALCEVLLKDKVQ